MSEHADVLMSLSRRSFLRRGAAFSMGFAGLGRALLASGTHRGLILSAGYGPLVPDPAGIIDLPAGFSYQLISTVGQWMDDGLVVPGRHDGMAAFPGPDGLTILMRNHEVEEANLETGPFGYKNELLGKIPAEMIFDRGRGRKPSRGGVTRVVYDTRADGGRGKLVHHELALAGTERNCAGGPTPRNTWLTCEESVLRAGKDYEQDHGYIFEVPAQRGGGLVKPEPLKAMGRFYHEACATNPASGVVYMTEDRDDSALYRFVPAKADRLSEGGRLQAMTLTGRFSPDLRNWADPRGFRIGTRAPVGWVDIEDVESPGDTLRAQAHSKGAAIFARGEGMWFGHGCVYFVCTTGGVARMGQVWRYTPPSASVEGTRAEAEAPGVLDLFIEPNNSSAVHNADNITVSPWGDLFVCEDWTDIPGNNSLVGITPTGEVYRFGCNLKNNSELAGVTFSPDGTTMFVNIQNPGMTIAIRGEWRRA